MFLEEFLHHINGLRLAERAGSENQDSAGRDERRVGLEQAQLLAPVPEIVPLPAVAPGP